MIEAKLVTKMNTWINISVRLLGFCIRILHYVEQDVAPPKNSFLEQLEDIHPKLPWSKSVS